MDQGRLYLSPIGPYGEPGERCPLLAQLIGQVPHSWSLIDYPHGPTGLVPIYLWAPEEVHDALYGVLVYLTRRFGPQPDFRAALEEAVPAEWLAAIQAEWEGTVEGSTVREALAGMVQAHLRGQARGQAVPAHVYWLGELF